MFLSKNVFCKTLSRHETVRYYAGNQAKEKGGVGGKGGGGVGR